MPGGLNVENVSCHPGGDEVASHAGREKWASHSQFHFISFKVGPYQINGVISPL